MMYGFVGIYGKNDEPLSGVKGNGKTAAIVFFAYDFYLQGLECYSNFYTEFSTQMSTIDIIELMKEEKKRNCVVMITEIQQILNSLDRKKDVLELCDNFNAQSRKGDFYIFWDSQRFMEVDIRVRNKTDVIMQPFKCHYDESKSVHTLPELLSNECFNDICKQNHIIVVDSVKPIRYKPVAIFYANKVGQLYNTYEFIKEKKYLDVSKEVDIILAAMEKPDITPKELLQLKKQYPNAWKDVINIKKEMRTNKVGCIKADV